MPVNNPELCGVVVLEGTCAYTRRNVYTKVHDETRER